MPLSEALAARHHAHRPWWRRAAQSIEHRVPATLHGRWALSLPAATAVAVVAIGGAAAGGWYLTRSQSTVVDVAGKAGDAASATPAPDDDHPMPSAEGGDSVKAGGVAAEHDGACRTHARPSGSPQALPPVTAPTGWHMRALSVMAADARPASATGWHESILTVVPIAAHPAASPSGQRARTVTIVPVVADPALARNWSHAPLTRRYAKAMAAKRPSCPPHTAMSTTPAVAGPAAGSEVVVDVEGKVARPGIATLPAGSRVYEALAAAGGALPGVDVTALDLARPVTDGEQLRVGIAGAPSPVVGLPQPSSSGAAHGKRGKTTQPVNLNTATLEQLETVPAVGPALAQRILDWRTEHGRFESVAQLRQVRGIGDRKFADMRDSVTV
ncbi:putative DNA-binding protein [Catenulispora acidiphila DSM 44928]|uniref:Putative DNA-binding protein n=1 Tax=Catenulispora acidiphila (strain DSM 44928 / JCM 14897 / NBRC 102108 / NRRL B-24433 / ID139908) TaxID=479433 RepID=C7Q5D9_CATAD|nr:ComEA family DNA-binding protein [Catenulispora acidiphila]ACU75908.1 putative DNA-binding protein [Catenulispora acidiphila DSM 44928]